MQSCLIIWGLILGIFFEGKIHLLRLEVKQKSRHREERRGLHRTALLLPCLYGWPDQFGGGVHATCVALRW
jgi:hypothetical protein